jgi:hypothetical protein
MQPFSQFHSRPILCAALAWVALAGAAFPQPVATNWNVFTISPWVALGAKALATNNRERVAEKLVLSGPRNDWLTGAVLLKSHEPVRVTLRMDAGNALTNRIELRAVGQYVNAFAEKNTPQDGYGQVTYSILLDGQNIRKGAGKTWPRIRNMEQLKDFPTVLVTPDAPVFLWLTADLRGMHSGAYVASLAFSDAQGVRRSVPVDVDVLNAELPVDSPIRFLGWQSARSNETRFVEYWEHGVNVIWTTATDPEMAWKLSKGDAFYVFMFWPSWRHHPFTEEKKAECREFLAKLTKRMTALGIPKTKWAVSPMDEVHDKTAPLALEYSRYIKELDPEVLIFQNPAYVVDPQARKTVTTTLMTFTMLAPYVDIWCPYALHYQNKEVRDFLKKSGKVCWVYDIYLGQHPADAVRWQRKGAWFAWRYALSGFAHFSIDTFNTSTFDYTSILPGWGGSLRGGLLSTRAFEAHRQGIQEYKRLFALRQAGADTEQLNRWADTVLATNDPDVIDAIRADMDSLLVKLQAK